MYIKFIDLEGVRDGYTLLKLVKKLKARFSGYQPAPWLCAPLDSPHQATEPYFDSFSEGQKRGGGCFTSVWKILHRAGATAEMALFLFLDPTSQSSLTDKICNIFSLPDRLGWADIMGWQKFLKIYNPSDIQPHQRPDLSLLKFIVVHDKKPCDAPLKVL